MPPSPQPAGDTESGGNLISDLLWGTKRRQGMWRCWPNKGGGTIGSQVGRQIVRGILGRR